MLAALLAAVVVGLAVHVAVNRPLPGEVEALVAVRAVAPGATVVAGDVAVRRLPETGLPSGALTSAEGVVGRTAAAPLVPGRALVPADVRTTDALAGMPEGSAAAYLPLAEAAVTRTLVPGDRVDVHSPVDGAVVVSGALVLRPEPGDQPGVWLAVEGDEAVALARARGADPAGASLQVSLRPTRKGE